jgi:hypothetical protein
MSDTDTTTASADSTTDDAASQTSADDTTSTSADTATDSAADKALGDAGKKALDAMKAKWKAAETRANERDAAAATLQAKLDGKEAEHAADQAKREAELAALAKANDRIRKSEVKAAAKGVLADPQDAYKFLDLDSFDVSDDGEVDEDAIKAALDDLVKNKPYLAAQGGNRFQGTADGGARNEASKPSQLSEADLASMTPGEVNKARREGRLDNLLRK